MIPKRYYLTLFSMVPIVCAQVFIARQTFKEVRTNPRKLRLWRLIVISAALLISAAMLSQFGAFNGILPRTPVLALQTLMNLWGLTSVLAVAAYLLSSLIISSLPRSFQQERREALRVIAGAAVMSPVVAVGFGTFIERTNFEVRECMVAVRHLPPQLIGMRLLQLSDIHAGAFLSVRTLAKVVDQANELKASVAFVTGDLISVAKDPLDECLDQLARLKSDFGIYGCLGNHEVYAKAEEYTTVAGSRRGISFLRGDTKLIDVGGAALNIAGVDYEPFERRSHYLEHAAGLVRPGAVNVLLSHNPDVFPVAAAQGYDLTLAGHTHGGQVTFEILSPALNPARMLTPFVRGLYSHGDASGYVTRGIGTLGIPTRLGARPEITLLKLTRLA